MLRKNISVIAAFLFSLAIPVHLFAQEELLSTNRPIRNSRELVLTVGQDKGDLQGKDDKIIQAGIEYLHRLGGGILQILPGTYNINNALYLRPNITLRGSGKETVLRKTDGVVTPVTRDMDWYEYAIRVEDISGFTKGGGIMLISKKDTFEWTLDVFRGTIQSIEGDVLFLDNMPYKNFWVEKGASATTIFPIITADEHTDDVIIENIILDGNLAHNDYINGNFAGAVFIQNCDKWKFQNVTARHYNGDGYSFQVCDDIHFDNCKSLDNAGLGFHPGSGSQRPVFKNCTSSRNDLGIFFCWGVSDGLAENCILRGNQRYGISIGHRDTDNLIKGCTIENNGNVGIYFREPGGIEKFRAGNRNAIEDCDINNNGTDGNGIGIDIGWEITDISIRGNRIGNNDGQGRQQTGIQISKDAKRITLEENSFSDSPVEVDDHRPNGR